MQRFLEPIVQTREGCIRGFITKDSNGIFFYNFLGIRYGKIPYGVLRFKAPVPQPPWEGILDAIAEPDIVVDSQDKRNTKNLEVFGSEDVLYLNVYTRELPSSSTEPLKPVMVFIHGGIFTKKNSMRNLYGPAPLMSEDVVLVTVQYRLGCFGFLVLADENLEVTGNAGLKDIVLALRWVKNNIAMFKGDPDNVTIFGENTGGVAVHYLLLSPQTKGLFHKVIAQSGSCLGSWSAGCSPNGHLLAEALEFYDRDEKKILEYLQKTSAARIYRAQLQLQIPCYIDTVRYFSPVIEKPSKGAFITDFPLNIISSGKYNKLPLIMGYKENDGLSVVALEKHLNKKPMMLTKNIVPRDLCIIESSKYEKIEKKIENFYNLKNIVTLENRAPKELIDLCTDLYFLKHISLGALLHSTQQHEPVYFYKVTANTQLNCSKYYLNARSGGVGPGDELGYLFDTLLIDVVPGSIEDITRRCFLKLWTTFARTGNPNPREENLMSVEWKPIQNAQFNYLDIGNVLKDGINPDYERVKFWFNMYKCKPTIKVFLENFF